MYAPRKWGTYANGELFEYWQATANGSVAALVANPEPIDFEDLTTPHSDAQIAIEGGDARDPEEGFTLKSVFDELLRVAHEVSGYCEYSSLWSYFFFR